MGRRNRGWTIAGFFISGAGLAATGVALVAQFPIYQNLANEHGLDALPGLLKAKLVKAGRKVPKRDLFPEETQGADAA